jgi:PIN domain nuclease of toxin-antitoxin system
MNLLLDTHIWIWARAEPARLTSAIARALDDGANELWLSPLSIWEVLLLAKKGRLPAMTPPEEWIPGALTSFPMREAPVTSEVALATSRIELPHRDPVDVLLAATARVFDLTLVSADERILQGRGFEVFPNR